MENPSQMSNGTQAKIILSAAETAVQEIVRLINDPDRLGGYFSLFLNGDPYLTKRMGTINDIGPTSASERIRKYCSYSFEKASRLWTNYLRQEHLLSWQTRELAKKQYGGAALFIDKYKRVWILSFSGFLEMQDEAAMLLTGALTVSSMKKAREMAAISNNQTFLEYVGKESIVDCHDS